MGLIWASSQAVNNHYKYKAYISYSHCDSRWASWLHKALESYRLPRKLIGIETDVGEVPGRIRPVFRDRDDLSSAADLGHTVEKALSDSENMIVICSPDAVASHWVNEEIRRFAKSGRANQIFCVIVAGEPGGINTAATCFPGALAESGLHEPLAADVRKWADGKRLSKLKIISGILGLPLDQLRRRDLQKRHKTWTVVSVASVVAAAVLVTAVTARISTQQRRNSGESLVAYKLNELRTMLNVTDDPENLDRLKQWNERDLGRLIAYAGVGKDALKASALTLREEGIGIWQNGNLTEAMKKFQQSWALLAVAYRRHHSNHLTFFELGQAEYWIGQTYMDQGDLESTKRSFMAYAEITRRLILMQPEKAEWVLEMAYALTNLGNLQKSIDENNPDRTLQFMQSSLEYNQIALVLDPANDYYRSELGQSHAFLADAQLNVCDLEGALKSRTEHVQMEKKLLEAEPVNPRRVERMAYALTGYASVREFQGDVDEAIDTLGEAISLLNDKLLQGIDERETAILILERQQSIARMMALKGETDKARVISNIVYDNWSDLKGIDQEDLRTALVYINLLLDRNRLAISDNGQDAGHLLTDIQLHLVASLKNLSFKRSAENLLVQAAFEQWEISGELPPANILSHLPVYESGSGRTRACTDASTAVLKFVMLEDIENARKLTSYLLKQGYREASFIKVCRAYSLCEQE